MSTVLWCLLTIWVIIGSFIALAICSVASEPKKPELQPLLKEFSLNQEVTEENQIQPPKQQEKISA